MTSTAAVFEEVLSDTYAQLHKLIYWTVKRYHKRFGGDIEELNSIGHYYFMLAVHEYDPKRGDLTTHVCNRVRYGLMTEANKNHRQAGFLEAKSLDYEYEQEETLKEKVISRREFDLMAFLEEVSDEAREVIQAALDFTDEKPLTRQGLWEIFREAGWTVAEFIRAFNEIREAIL